MSRQTLCMPLVLLLACGGDKDAEEDTNDYSLGSGDDTASGDDGGGDDGDNGDADPVLLQEGGFTVDKTSLDDDPCSLDTYQDPTASVPPTMTIAHTGDWTFTVDAPDQDQTDCVQDGWDFACSETAFSQDLTELSLDASMDFTSVLTGSVRSLGAAFVGATELVVTCTGEDCALLEGLGITFPCELTVGMEASAD